MAKAASNSSVEAKLRNQELAFSGSRLIKIPRGVRSVQEDSCVDSRIEEDVILFYVHFRSSCFAIFCSGPPPKP